MDISSCTVSEWMSSLDPDSYCQGDAGLVQEALGNHFTDFDFQSTALNLGLETVQEPPKEAKGNSGSGFSPDSVTAIREGHKVGGVDDKKSPPSFGSLFGDDDSAAQDTRSKLDLESLLEHIQVEQQSETQYVPPHLTLNDWSGKFFDQDLDECRIEPDGVVPLDQSSAEPVSVYPDAGLDGVPAPPPAFAPTDRPDT
jgi:hypothetical protein